MPYMDGIMMEGDRNNIQVLPLFLFRVIRVSSVSFSWSNHVKVVIKTKEVKLIRQSRQGRPITVFLMTVWPENVPGNILTKCLSLSFIVSPNVSKCLLQPAKLYSSPSFLESINNSIFSCNVSVRITSTWTHWNKFYLTLEGCDLVRGVS